VFTAARRSFGRPLRRLLLLPLLVLMVLPLTGCIRMRAALEISPQDTVSGEVTIATLAAGSDDSGPNINVPKELAGRVTTSAYNADGYVGQKIEFEQLSFDDVKTLAAGLSDWSSRYQLNLRRSGELMSLSGSVDLNQMPQDRADFELRVALPGSIMRTNGVPDGNVITWTPKPGGVTEFVATTEYSNEAEVSLGNWALIVGGGSLLVAIFVGFLARSAHRRDIRTTASPLPPGY
jgi:hypothetical protein